VGAMGIGINDASASVKIQESAASRYRPVCVFPRTQRGQSCRGRYGGDPMLALVVCLTRELLYLINDS
jgi:hypothetical protein